MTSRHEMPAAPVFGNPDQPPQGAINAADFTDPGPQNPVIAAHYLFIFPLATSQPVRETKSGFIQVADSTNFKVAQTVASALVTVKPGGVREMDWHPNADEWQYYIKGKARMTVFNTGPNAITMDFSAGDVGYVPKNLGHYVENVGDTDLQFIGVFRASRYQEISLTNWLTRTPPSLVAQHLDVTEAVIAEWPHNNPGIMPQG